MNNEEIIEVTNTTIGTQKTRWDKTRKPRTSDVNLKELRKKVKASRKPKNRRTYHEFVQTSSDVRAIRENIGLSQREFAALLCVSKRTLEGWEQGHRVLNGPVRALLTIFKYDPESAIRVLHKNK